MYMVYVNSIDLSELTSTLQFLKNVINTNIKILLFQAYLDRF
jgi:hypothetical protein